jgi:predicted nucleic acid-binding protein
LRGTPLHTAVRRFFEHEIHDRGGLLGLTPQVIQEFLHVATDSRRFEHPLAMPEALRVCRSLASSREAKKEETRQRRLQEAIRKLEADEKLGLK